LILIEYSGSLLSLEGHGGHIEALIEGIYKTTGNKTRTVEQCIYRYNSLSLLKHMLACLGVKLWNGEVTEIELVEIDQANMTQDTALHLAVERCSSSSVLSLVEAKADTEIRNSSGQTALHLAAQHGTERPVQSLRLVQALLDAGAKPAAVNKAGKSCLEMAVLYNTVCTVALQRVGADGWTPLMVAAEKGGYAIENYLWCRGYFHSVQSRQPFTDPEYLRNEVQFYSGLSESKTEIEWKSKGRKEPGDETAGSASTLSCALAKEELKNGIYTWTIQVDFEDKAWIGVARNTEDVTCDPDDLKNSKTCYIVYFDSKGKEGVVGVAHQQSKPVFFDKNEKSSFLSGQSVELRLDTFKTSLEMRLNGTTRCVAHNIDVHNIYPYVRFNPVGSVTTLASCMLVSTSMPLITETEASAGCDNMIWSPDLDLALCRCFNLGETFCFCFIVWRLTLMLFIQIFKTLLFATTNKFPLKTRS
jgi:hypothetical protein